MKKSAFIGIAVVLGLNGFASECKLLLKPSDFQLDKNFVVQNESKVFSRAGNWSEQNYMFGYSKGRFCGGIQTVYNRDKAEACWNEFSNISEEYTLKHDIESMKGTTNQADWMYSQTKAYKLKTSKYTPISEEHLCYLQKKYGDKVISKKDTALAKQRIEEEQNNAYNHYALMAEKIGDSEDAVAIAKAFMNQQH